MPSKGDTLDTLFNSIITKNCNNILVYIPSPTKMKEASSTQTPSLNGFQLLFYKQCWNIVGSKVIKEI